MQFYAENDAIIYSIQRTFLPLSAILLRSSSELAIWLEVSLQVKRGHHDNIGWMNGLWRRQWRNYYFLANHKGLLSILQVLMPINQNYDKIRERKQASLIRFHKKKLYKMRANRARIWRVLSTYQQAWCVKCLITLCNYKHDLYSYYARLIGWKRVYFSCNMSTKTKM